MENAAGLRVIAPTMRNLNTLRLLAGLAAVAGALTLAILAMTGLPAHGSGRAVGGGIGLLGIGLFGTLYFWLWPANTRLLVGPNLVGYQNMLGRRRVWSTAEIARVVDLTILYNSRSTTTPHRALLLVGVNGRCLLALAVKPWSIDAIGEFIAATRRPADYLDGPVTVQQARQKYPGSVSWAYAHSGWMVALTIAAGLALVLLTLVFSVLLTQR